jgi:thiosulfate dehydrogenase
MRTVLSFLLSRLIITAAALGLLASAGAPAYADSKEDEEYHRDFIYGVPASPSDAWMTMSAGRIYDNWYATLDKDKPKATHPSWPASNTKKKGAVTWRCKSCHGWDFRGKDGAYRSGSYKTGIKGIRGMAGADPAKVVAVLRDGTHGFTTEMIPDDAAMRLAAFVSKGQYDITKWVSDKGDVKGDAGKGKPVYQTICAACHGFDGRALDWGDEKEPGFVGTEANANPWEVMAKIRHGHPGVEMVGLVAFPMQTSADVLAYTKTLPEK